MSLSKTERSEERRDIKAQIVIMKKDTEEVVERMDEYWDNAERVAKAAISGKKELKYKIYKVY
jgi:hypothetical protein